MVTLVSSVPLFRDTYFCTVCNLFWAKLVSTLHAKRLLCITVTTVKSFICDKLQDPSAWQRNIQIGEWAIDWRRSILVSNHPRSCVVSSQCATGMSMLEAVTETQTSEMLLQVLCLQMACLAGSACVCQLVICQCWNSWSIKGTILKQFDQGACLLLSCRAVFLLSGHVYVSTTSACDNRETKQSSTITLLPPVTQLYVLSSVGAYWGHPTYPRRPRATSPLPMHISVKKITVSCSRTQSVGLHDQTYVRKLFCPIVRSLDL